MSEQYTPKLEHKNNDEAPLISFTEGLINNEETAKLPKEEQGLTILRGFVQELVNHGPFEGTKATYDAEGIVNQIINVMEPADIQKFTRTNGLRPAVMALASDERVAPLIHQGMRDYVADILDSKPVKNLAEMMNGEQAPEKSVESGYDHLFSDDYAPGEVQDAAVRIAEDDDERLTRERRESDARAAVSDAYLAAKNQPNR
ncbi:MAG TPA: hypothetical protein VFS65_01620 [Candidatus Saccharimonadales bacterium]|nr:hypothetical protein [Candidatus Saccharimonadales bacterium]